MSDDPVDALRRRDEILQVMFWLRGEGLAEDAGPDILQRFLSDGSGVVAEDLETLANAGMIEPTGGGRYRLTERGAEEGGRRFADEFEGMQRQGHGACNDPECDCHQLGPEACEHAYA